MSYNRLYENLNVEGDNHWNYVELADGSRRKMTKEEINNHALLPMGAIPFRLMSLYPVGVNRSGLFKVEFRGKVYEPPAGNSWFTNPEGMKKLLAANRIEAYEDGQTLNYVLKLTDGPVSQLTNMWSDTSAPSDKAYAVQTSEKVVERCLLMTTRPGDLVLDPTCGSGTTARVAESWGRRWITVDVSRVPLAIARQKLLTRVMPYYRLKDEAHGPAGGFVYEHKTSARGLQTGGLVRTISRGTISNDEAAAEILLVNRPEFLNNVTRVSGPFTVEASIPTPLEAGLPEEEAATSEASDFGERLLEALRKSPVLRLAGNRTVTLKNVRPQAKTLSLSAEAVDEEGQPVAFVFGPENGAVSERLVFEAAREAYAKSYSHLYVIGLQIEANALLLVNSAAESVGIPTTYVPVTPDITMGDLLKNMRSSQIFSVCGLPDVALRPATDGKYEVELRGLDTFDPVTMDNDHMDGDDVPAWFLDTDYNGLCFHVTQAFFPRTSAWDNLKKTLKADYEPGVWDRLAGNLSVPFELGEHRQVAVKVIDDRGNELIVIKTEAEAEK